MLELGKRNNGVYVAIIQELELIHEDYFGAIHVNANVRSVQISCGNYMCRVNTSSKCQYIVYVEYRYEKRKTKL